MVLLELTNLPKLPRAGPISVFPISMNSGASFAATNSSTCVSFSSEPCFLKGHRCDTNLPDNSSSAAGGQTGLTMRHRPLWQPHHRRWPGLCHLHPCSFDLGVWRDLEKLTKRRDTHLIADPHRNPPRHHHHRQGPPPFHCHGSMKNPRQQGLAWQACHTPPVL
jgi:hypothetical protein